MVKIKQGGEKYWNFGATFRIMIRKKDITSFLESTLQVATILVAMAPKILELAT